MNAQGNFRAFSISYRFVEAKRENGKVRRSTESTEKYGKSVFRLGETAKTVQKSTDEFGSNFFQTGVRGQQFAGRRARAGGPPTPHGGRGGCTTKIMGSSSRECKTDRKYILRFVRETIALQS